MHTRTQKNTSLLLKIAKKYFLDSCTVWKNCSCTVWKITKLAFLASFNFIPSYYTNTMVYNAAIWLDSPITNDINRIKNKNTFYSCSMLNKLFISISTEINQVLIMFNAIDFSVPLRLPRLKDDRTGQNKHELLQYSVRTINNSKVSRITYPRKCTRCTKNEFRWVGYSCFCHRLMGSPISRPLQRWRIHSDSLAATSGIAH